MQPVDSKRLRIGLMISVVLVTSCAVHTPHDRGFVSSELSARAGSGLREPGVAGEFDVPEGVSLADGLTESEAVALALWNNAAFQANLAALGFSRADLLRAGLLRNPVLSVLFGRGSKQMEMTLAWPIDELWLRPRRIVAARLDAERIARGLVQSGLDQIRDTRIAYADAVQARDEAALEDERALVAERIAAIERRRLETGDSSALEADVSRMDAVQADQFRRSAALRSETAQARLRAALGLASNDETLELQVEPLAADDLGAIEPMVEAALAARPDLRAAESVVEAAGRRLGLERASIGQWIGLLDANNPASSDRETGPGLQWEIPIFNANRHGVARAKAEIEQASWRYVGLRQEIEREVREAAGRLGDAREAEREWNDVIVPGLDALSCRTARAVDAGEQAGSALWQSKLRLVEARLAATAAAAATRRARAQWVRAIGWDPSYHPSAPAAAEDRSPRSAALGSTRR